MGEVHLFNVDILWIQNPASTVLNVFGTKLRAELFCN